MLSKAINKTFNCNFNDLVNGYRIEAFSNLIKMLDLDSLIWYYYDKSLELKIEASICSVMTVDDINVVIFGGSSVTNETNQVTVISIHELLNPSNMIEIQLKK